MRRKESEKRTGKASALLRWTGFGALEDLERSATKLLAGRGFRVVRVGETIAGLSVELVHLRTNEESVVEAGRLYSELSHRIDPTRLKLTLLTGSKNSPEGVLAAWLKKTGEASPVFGGYHLECRRESSWRGLRGVVHPLLLFPEPEFRRVFNSLGLTGYFESNGLLPGLRDSVPSEHRVASFGGGRADLHEVVDSIK